MAKRTLKTPYTEYVLCVIRSGTLLGFSHSPSNHGHICITAHQTYIPDIHVALSALGTKLGLRMWSSPILAPTTLGPSSSGVIMTTDTATLAKTMIMTKTAMLMPFQFFWLGLAATSSCGERKLDQALFLPAPFLYKMENGHLLELTPTL